MNPFEKDGATASLSLQELLTTPLLCVSQYRASTCQMNRIAAFSLRYKLTATEDLFYQLTRLLTPTHLAPRTAYHPQ